MANTLAIVHWHTTKAWILGSLVAPMGIWSRAYSDSSRGTSDVQQWLRNSEARKA